METLIFAMLLISNVIFAMLLISNVGFTQCHSQHPQPNIHINRWVLVLPASNGRFLALGLPHYCVPKSYSDCLLTLIVLLLYFVALQSCSPQGSTCREPQCEDECNGWLGYQTLGLQVDNYWAKTVSTSCSLQLLVYNYWLANWHKPSWL